ncbi:hypothetical protein ACQY1H_13910 [Agrobacterium vitis]|uniref:hypothetical protein n=1 Tax=Agrobacterium vitis TaxID=373 RepID=UPI003D2B415B
MNDDASSGCSIDWTTSSTQPHDGRADRDNGMEFEISEATDHTGKLFASRFAPVYFEFCFL